MKLLRIGDTIINLDNVSHVARDAAGTVMIYGAGLVEPLATRGGQDGEALWKTLCALIETAPENKKFQRA